MGSCPTIPITVRSHLTIRLYEEEGGGGRRRRKGGVSSFRYEWETQRLPPLLSISSLSPLSLPLSSVSPSLSPFLSLALPLALHHAVPKLTFTFRSRMLMPSIRTAPGSSKPPSGIILPLSLSAGATLSLPFFSFFSFLSPPLAACRDRKRQR